MSPRVLRAFASLAVVVGFALSAGSEMAGQSGIRKSLFLCFVDEAGKPARNLAGEIFIREDGADRKVVEVKGASQPISVAMLIDTAQGNRVKDAYGTPEGYVQDLRVAVAAFARQLLNQAPDASVSLMEFGQAAITMVPYTQSFEDFDKGVKRIVARPDVGSVLFEALDRANSELAKRPSARRAIVSLNLEPSDEQSREDPKKVQTGFGSSGAQLWAVSVQRGGLKNSKRDLVLNDLAKATGGQRDFVVGISAVENILKGYADALAAQFEVVYERPENTKTVKSVQVGTSIRGVKVHASGFAPQ
jgi:von Willebrand factor type A domain